MLTLRVFRHRYLESSEKPHKEDSSFCAHLADKELRYRAVNPSGQGSPELVVLKALPSLAQTSSSSCTFVACVAGASPPHPCSSHTRHAFPTSMHLPTLVLISEHTSDSCLSSEPAPMPPPLCCFPGTVPSPPPATFPVRKAVSVAFYTSILELISLCHNCNDWRRHPSAPGNCGLLENQDAWEPGTAPCTWWRANDRPAGNGLDLGGAGLCCGKCSSLEKWQLVGL